MSDYRIWPDDQRRALSTWALAATSTSDENFEDAIRSIEDGVRDCGRPVAYVLALLEVFTEPPADKILHTPGVAEMLRRKALEAQTREDELRARGEWRQDDNERNE